MFNNELKVQILRGLAQSLVAIVLTVLGGVSFYKGVTDQVNVGTFVFIVIGIVLAVLGFILAWTDPNKSFTRHINLPLWGKPDAK